MHACVGGAPPPPKTCAHSINSNRQLVRSSDDALSYNKKIVENTKLLNAKGVKFQCKPEIGNSALKEMNHPWLCKK